MVTDAYKYNNLILVKNGLTAEGVRQIKNTLNSLTNKFAHIDGVDGLLVPFHLTPKDLLVCRVKTGAVQFYHVSKDVDIESKINGIILKYNDVSLNAEKNNDYSQEYRILNIDNVEDILER